MPLIAAAAIVAVGTAAGAAISAQGASSAAKAGKGKQHRFPIPPYQHALDQYTARLLAENETRVAPSFADFIKSGGTATFGLEDTGLTPREAQNLKLVGPRGTQIPYVNPSQGKLTPEQQLFVGFQERGSGSALARAYHVNERIRKIIQNNPDQTGLIDRLREKRGKLLSSPTSGGLA